MDSHPGAHCPPARPDHIDRLPTEILSTVFTIVYWDTPPFMSRATWVQFMLVCRRWRYIIVDTTALWSNFASYQLVTPVAVEIHIQRSRAAPLEVWISSKHPLLQTRILPWIVTQRARIRKLVIVDTKSAANGHYQELLSGDFPVLVTLRLYGNEHAPKPTTGPSSTAARFPNLTELKLDRWELTSGFHIASLRSLVLCECDLMMSAEDPLGRFLDMLATCATLEQVEISDCFLSPEPFAAASDRIVSLPLLTAFTLKGLLPEFATSRLLAHIHVPHTAHLTLTGGDMDLSEIQEYADLLPPDRGTLPILTRCTHMQVQSWRCEGRSDDGGAITLRVFGADATWGLDACVAIFAPSPVVHLHVPADAPPGVPPDAPLDAHLAAFEAFPLVETLRLDASRVSAETLVGVFTALGTEGVCPRLRSFWIGWCAPSVEVLEAMERWARMRHERGMRLAKLGLELLHTLEPGCRHPPGGPTKIVGAVSGDGGEGDSAEGASGDGPEEEAEYSARVAAGCPEEIEYWKGEFVADLEPLVDEIVYEAAKLSYY